MCAVGASHPSPSPSRSYNFSAAVSASGNLYTWGWGANGRLGLRDCGSRYEPEKVAIESGAAVALARCGTAHMGCVDTRGSVYVWGCGRKVRVPPRRGVARRGAASFADLQATCA